MERDYLLPGHIATLRLKGATLPDYTLETCILTSIKFCNTYLCEFLTVYFLLFAIFSIFSYFSHFNLFITNSCRTLRPKDAT